MICADALGTDSVLCVPGLDVSGGASLKEAFEASYLALSEMKQEIEDSQIYVCLENVWNGFFTLAERHGGLYRPAEFPLYESLL